ncbi:MAG: transporter solute receptor, family [Hyphomicrobiales bacterium]|nr:transporter solute receptor, family [Hyphomicrobiales bacterium]
MIHTLRHRALAVAAGAVAALALAGAPAFAQSAAKPDVRIATGTPGGAYYVMGAVLADVLTRSGRVASATAEAASGAIESARLVDSGQSTLAAMDANWVDLGLKGGAPFKKKIDLVTIVPLGVWGLFFVSLQDGEVKSLDDLKGKRVAVGAKGSGMEMHARQIITSIGWDFEKDIKPVYLAFGPGASAVREGRADAQLQCCIPNAGLSELSELAKARMVTMSPDQLKKTVGEGRVYASGFLKKDAFRGHAQDTPVINILNGYMGVASLDENTAYVIAKTYIENIDQMIEKTPQYASVKELFEQAKTAGPGVLEMGAPLHPGAVRAFREAGILK